MAAWPLTVTAATVPPMVPVTWVGGFREYEPSPGLVIVIVGPGATSWNEKLAVAGFPARSRMEAARLWPPGARVGEVQEAAAGPTVQPVSAVPSRAMLKVEVSTPEPLSKYVTVIGGAGLSMIGWLGEVMASAGGVGSTDGTWRATTRRAGGPELASRETKSTRPLAVSSLFASSQPSFVAAFLAGEMAGEERGGGGARDEG